MRKNNRPKAVAIPFLIKGNIANNRTECVMHKSEGFKDLERVRKSYCRV